MLPEEPYTGMKYTVWNLDQSNVHNQQQINRFLGWEGWGNFSGVMKKSCVLTGWWFVKFIKPYTYNGTFYYM